MNRPARRKADGGLAKWSPILLPAGTTLVGLVVLFGEMQSNQQHQTKTIDAMESTQALRHRETARELRALHEQGIRRGAAIDRLNEKLADVTVTNGIVTELAKTVGALDESMSELKAVNVRQWPVIRKNENYRLQDALRNHSE